jgi:hypothetical protein
MHQITTVQELRSAIKELEFKQAGEWPALKEKFLATAEMLKPQNIMKATFMKVVSDPDLKAILLNGVFGLTTGFIGNSVLRGAAAGPISKLIARAFMRFATTGNLIKAIAGFKSVSGVLIKKITV